ncbi:MAG: hypothetical protein NVS3B3_11370 [Aquirhabdus sp.]
MTRPVPVLIDYAKFDSFAEKFNILNKAYRRSGAAMNVWRAAGLGHDELRNSRVLAWMLDRDGDHGQGSIILEQLLDEVNKELDYVTVSANQIRGKKYRTKTESLPLGEQESRVDIEIEGDEFLIFIEVKIRAPESRDQLRRYLDLARHKAGANKSWLVIFLTVNGKKPMDPDLHTHIINLSWKNIANILERPIASDDGFVLPNQIFCQFADHIRRL